MEWLIGLVAVLGGAAGGRVLLGRRAQRRAESERAVAELDGVRAMADEDTTLLGEQLAALGRETVGRDLDEPTRADYQDALDAYESAKRAVPRLDRAEDVSAVVDTLSSGRYALACVRARLDGRPLPENRVPCFFNPQHGPSTRDVRFTVPGGRGTRTVPACAQDASRVEAGERPEVRKVLVGDTYTSVWDAGATHLPYGKEYFQRAVLESGYRDLQQGGWGGS